MARYPDMIRYPLLRRLALVAGCMTLLQALPAVAGVCTTTADVLQQACHYDGKEERRVAVANCLNLVDAAERDECRNDIEADRIERAEECREVHEARLDVCAQVGENRYDPDYDRSDFDSDWHHLSHPNPYFPLAIGNRWEYGGSDEINTVEVLDRTKRIEGVLTASWCWTRSSRTASCSRGPMTGCARPETAMCTTWARKRRATRRLRATTRVDPSW